MGQRKGRNFIFWLDLECTGSGDDEDVLELGASITDRDLNELDAKSFIFPTTEDKIRGMKQVVVDMHTKNGLIHEIKIVSPMERDMALAQADDELAAWIRTFAGGDHMVIGGSGVAHYDRKYIKRDFPNLDARLTHFHLDISSIRRGMEYAGIKWSEDFYTKTHRALDDARQHRDEFRRFMLWCQESVRLGNDYEL